MVGPGSDKGLAVELPAGKSVAPASNKVAEMADPGHGELDWNRRGVFAGSDYYFHREGSGFAVELMTYVWGLDAGIQSLVLAGPVVDLTSGSLGSLVVSL